MSKTQRRQAKRRLARSLARLNSYSQEPNIPQCTSWPSRELLASVEDDVRIVSNTDRLSWKTFQRLDMRLPSLLLVRRFDILVNRALTRLKENRKLERAGRDLIQWLAKLDHPTVKALRSANRAAARVIREQIRLEETDRREKKRQAARIRKQRERLQKKFDKKA